MSRSTYFIISNGCTYRTYSKGTDAGTRNSLMIFYAKRPGKIRDKTRNRQSREKTQYKDELRAAEEETKEIRL